MLNLRNPAVWSASFWKKVIRIEGECWPWRGATNESGYGTATRWTGRRWANVRAHRVAWELTNGRPPAPGLVIRHLCHNPICCNPAHLVEGTQKDNVRDMISAKRFARGSAAGRAKLTEERVAELRARHSEGATVDALAAETGVPRATVWNVVTRRSWKHVPGPSPLPLAGATKGNDPSVP